MLKRWRYKSSDSFVRMLIKHLLMQMLALLCCQTVHMKYLQYHNADFHEILYSRFFTTLC